MLAIQAEVRVGKSELLVLEERDHTKGLLEKEGANREMGTGLKVRDRADQAWVQGGVAEDCADDRGDSKAAGDHQREAILPPRQQQLQLDVNLAQ